jgi:AP-4 complex subunit sigma-1
MKKFFKKNEYTYYSFIHLLVETLNKYFEKVCELDIIMNLEKTYYIIEEMILNGNILEANKDLIIEPVKTLDKVAK